MNVEISIGQDASSQDSVFKFVYEGDLDALLADRGAQAREGLAGLALANGAQLVAHTTHGAIWAVDSDALQVLRSVTPDWARVEVLS